MDKKNYQTPAAEVVKLQSTHMMAGTNDTQGPGSAGSRSFHGSVEDDEEGTSLEE